MNQNLYYTNEQNAQMLLYLLKQHGIKRVIASPGATNVALVASMQHDPFFEMYSCVDERSAAYMACGMAEESGEPVILSCTGATSSRNYMPGLTEAFYRRLPILVVTSSMDSNKNGHLYAQFTDRSTPPVDCVKSSFYIQKIKDNDDKWNCVIKLNEALIELTDETPGPVHLNLVTNFSTDFSIRELPPINCIRKYTYQDQLPELPQGRIGIFVGQHKKMGEDEVNAIEQFCAAYDGVVLCDHTSSYYGQYKILPALIASQERGHEELLAFDLIIHIGEISGEYYTLRNLHPKEVWRVSKDGVLRDRFKKLTAVFEMEEKRFFIKYSKNNKTISNKNYTTWKSTYDFLLSRMPEIPFSTLWIASELSKKIPSNTTLYLSILNCLRSWNFYETSDDVCIISNVGGFGIDGMTSSLIGASLANPEKLFLGVTGDLNFFYDLNALGNRHIGSNVRILLINNGHGQEFRTYKHSASVLGEEVDEYIAAARHFGNQSKTFVSNFAQSLGFNYLAAENKEEFSLKAPYFLSEKIGDKPIIFEVFTNNDNEYESLKRLQNIEPKTIEQQTKESVKNLLGNKGAGIIRKFIK